MPKLKHRLTILLSSTLLLLSITLWYKHQQEPVLPTGSFPSHWPPPTATVASAAARQNATRFNGQWNYTRDRDNLMLRDEECEVAFPGLFDEIGRAMRRRRRRKVTLAELDGIEPRNGFLRGMVFDQQLYVLSSQGKIYSRQLATLHSLHRAILTSPDPLPNIEFAVNSDDVINDPVALWGYARRARDKDIWLIPDFGHWSWPETKVGTMREVQMKAEQTEKDDWIWDKKVPKLLWRGAVMRLELREKLLDVTSDQPWADVKPINWHDHYSVENSVKSMPQHCEYKYLAHTEGNSYSGRLKYLQNCKSVVIAHKMDWIQHHHPLMRSSGPDQNYVQVRRDFKDLQQKIQWLVNHDEDAERIATNNVRTFRQRYLTPAAEVCYWRRLIRSWAAVSFPPDFFKEVNGTKVWRGLPVESFLLEGRMEWDPY